MDPPLTVRGSPGHRRSREFASYSVANGSFPRRARRETVRLIVVRLLSLTGCTRPTADPSVADDRWTTSEHCGAVTSRAGGRSDPADTDPIMTSRPRRGNGRVGGVPSGTRTESVMRVCRAGGAPGDAVAGSGADGAGER